MAPAAAYLPETFANKGSQRRAVASIGAATADGSRAATAARRGTRPARRSAAKATVNVERLGPGDACHCSRRGWSSGRDALCTARPRGLRASASRSAASRRQSRRRSIPRPAPPGRGAREARRKGLGGADRCPSPRRCSQGSQPDSAAETQEGTQELQKRDPGSENIYDQQKNDKRSAAEPVSELVETETPVSSVFPLDNPELAHWILEQCNAKKQDKLVPDQIKLKMRFQAKRTLALFSSPSFGQQWPVYERLYHLLMQLQVCDRCSLS